MGLCFANVQSFPLIAAQNSSSQHSTSSSSSAAIGVAATYGSEGMTLGITASGSRSVGQQTGIAAGDSGFQIDVKGNTDLKGAVIASTQNAIDQNKNNFSTGTLTQSELQNHSNYEASSWGIGLSAGKADEGKAQTAQSDAVQVASFTGGLSGTSAGFSSKDGSSASTTHSGISGNTNGTGIAITDDLKQQSLTGKTAAETVAGISRDITTGTDSGSLIKDWDAQKLKDKVTAGAQITAAFGQAAAERIGTYADDKVKELENTDPAEAARWKEGGQYRVALHTATGALTGGLAGAAGAFTSATAMPIIGEAIEQMGLPKEVAQGLNQVAAGALGAVVGGAAGAASGVNVEANNRQLHPTEKQWIKDNAADYAKQKGITVEQAQQILTAQADRQVQFGSAGEWDAGANAFLSQAGKELLPAEGANGTGYMFYATPAQKADTTMYGQYGNGNVPSNGAISDAANRDQAIRENLANATLAAAALAGGIAGAGPAVGGEAWAAYRAATAAYSPGAALGTGMAVGGASYTGSAALSAAYDQRFGTGQDFSTGFDQRFSYAGLAAAMTVGGYTSMYSTAMFGWAGVPNALSNWATMPGAVIRTTSAVFGNAAGQAAQGAVKSSSKP